MNWSLVKKFFWRTLRRLPIKYRLNLLITLEKVSFYGWLVWFILTSILHISLVMVTVVLICLYAFVVIVVLVPMYLITVFITTISGDRLKFPFMINMIIFLLNKVPDAMAELVINGRTSSQG
jgi:hypothetical protein